MFFKEDIHFVSPCYIYIYVHFCNDLFVVRLFVLDLFIFVLTCLWSVCRGSLSSTACGAWFSTPTTWGRSWCGPASTCPRPPFSGGGNMSVSFRPSSWSSYWPRSVESPCRKSPHSNATEEIQHSMNISGKLRN